jgi:hypothetical protein
MHLPSEPGPGESARPYVLGAVALLIVAAIATAASWQLYPVFFDTFYHMAVIEGFSQAGGITARAFWEMAPGGRVHIYPPSLHVIGYFFYLLGVSPGTFMTLVSGTLFASCLLTTWIWLRQITGPRSALFGLILLCGPYAFCWGQATFQALAGVMVLAPLALLALEKERFVACGVLNFVASTMHPMGLFLPPALVINTLLRRKKIVAGLLAASLPVLLYAPWLAHIWANRAFLPENRTGGEISLSGVGGGANLGLFLAVPAAIAPLWLVRRRGPALGLIGAAAGFAVVFPMGFGSRFLSYNIHWPLACLGGYGLGELVGWLEHGMSVRGWKKHLAGRSGMLARCLKPLGPAAHLLSIVVLGTALVAYPAVSLPLGGPGPPTRANLRAELKRMLSDARFAVQASALPKLFDAYSGAGSGFGMGPGGPPMLGGPGMGPGGPPRGFGGPGMGLAGFGGPPPGFGGPAMGAGRSDTGPGPPGSGPSPRPSGSERAMGQRSPIPSARPTGPGRGAAPGMFGMNLLRRPGAEDFFEAVRTNTTPGDVIYMADPASANLIAGATGRWTSSGILRDVRSENGQARPKQCDFAVVLGGGMGMPGPFGPMGFSTLPSDFEKVFENEYGTLSRNPAKVEHVRQPLAPEVSLARLAAIAMVGLLLVLVDLCPFRRPAVRPVAAAVGTIVAALCLLPLANTAIGELRHPPSAPPGRGEGPPGFGPPGFGGPGFGPGQFLAQSFLREADAGPGGTLSPAKFKALAARCFAKWDANRNGSLDFDEFALGLRSVLGPPPEAGGSTPSFGGPPPGFGPEVFLARPLFSACDSNGDGKVTREEMVAAFQRWFRQWDESSKGSLDAEALAKGLNRLLGVPEMPKGPD